MPYVFIDPADYVVGKAISAEEYAQLVDNANQANEALVVHGEIFATRGSVTTVGSTGSVTGSAPGPYSWTVPVGVSRISVELVAGGGGGGAGMSPINNATAGGTSSVSGSTSGSLISATGGQPGDNGGGGTSAPGAGGTGSSTGGYRWVNGTSGSGTAGGASVLGPEADQPASEFGGGGNAGTTGGGGGGGGASKKKFLTVVPGETLTITVGAGGDQGLSAGNVDNGSVGYPGYVRISF